MEKRKAFNEIKSILSLEPVFSIYNPKSATEIHCDAVIDIYGSVLKQQSPVNNQSHTVYFVSKKTTDAELKYTRYELAVLAVIQVLKKLRVYLFGIAFKIVTDCNAFKMIMDKKDIRTKLLIVEELL